MNKCTFSQQKEKTSGCFSCDKRPSFSADWVPEGCNRKRQWLQTGCKRVREKSFTVYSVWKVPNDFRTPKRSLRLSKNTVKITNTCVSTINVLVTLPRLGKGQLLTDPKGILKIKGLWRGRDLFLHTPHSYPLEVGTLGKICRPLVHRLGLLFQRHLVFFEVRVHYSLHPHPFLWQRRKGLESKSINTRKKTRNI